jgi:hypothetical protein
MSFHESVKMVKSLKNGKVEYESFLKRLLCAIIQPLGVKMVELRKNKI